MSHSSSKTIVEYDMSGPSTVCVSHTDDNGRFSMKTKRQSDLTMAGEEALRLGIKSLAIVRHQQPYLAFLSSTVVFMESKSNPPDMVTITMSWKLSATKI